MNNQPFIIFILDKNSRVPNDASTYRIVESIVKTCDLTGDIKTYAGQKVNTPHILMNQLNDPENCIVAAIMEDNTLKCIANEEITNFKHLLEQAENQTSWKILKDN